MSVEDYRDNFRYIHGNLTEWLPDGCRAVAADNRYSLARWAGAYWKVSAGMLLRAYAEEYAAPGEEDGAVSRIHISYEEPCTKRQLIEKAARSAEGGAEHQMYCRKRNGAPHTAQLPRGCPQCKHTL